MKKNQKNRKTILFVKKEAASKEASVDAKHVLIYLALQLSHRVGVGALGNQRPKPQYKWMCLFPHVMKLMSCRNQVTYGYGLMTVGCLCNMGDYDVVEAAADPSISNTHHLVNGCFR